MYSRLCLFAAILGLLVVTHTTVRAQEPTVGGLNMKVVRTPTPDDPTLVLDVGPWVDANCDGATLIATGHFDLDIGESSDTIRWGWYECLLVDPHGVEHCLGTHITEIWQIGTTVGPFNWWQGFFGGDPVYGDSLMIYRVDFLARDLTPRLVTVRGSYDFRYSCEGGLLRPDVLLPAEISFFIGCRADFDADGALTIFDFLAYQNAFSAGDPIADFDGDGELTLFDFLAFQNAFDAGCG
jgi:hypothetical protein